MATQTNDELGRFADKNPDFRERWRALKKAPYVPIPPTDAPEELIPYSGMPAFARLNDTEKRDLYFAFAQMNAEVIVFLELLLFVVFRNRIRVLRDNPEGLGEQRALQKILDEEAFHTRAYLRFLRNEKALDFPRRSLFLRRYPRFKRICLWVASVCPAALALPGAKIEAYSVHYAQLLRRCYAGAMNTWAMTNYNHMLDEVHHIPFEFDLYNHHMAKVGWVKKLWSVFGTLLFIGLLQFCLYFASRSIVDRCFPSASKWRRRQLTLQFGRWSIRVFSPYKETRKVTARFFLEKQPFAKNILSFMHK